MDYKDKDKVNIVDVVFMTFAVVCAIVSYLLK